MYGSFFLKAWTVSSPRWANVSQCLTGPRVPPTNEILDIEKIIHKKSFMYNFVHKDQLVPVNQGTKMARNVLKSTFYGAHGGHLFLEMCDALHYFKVYSTVIFQYIFSTAMGHRGPESSPLYTNLTSIIF